MPVDHGMNAFAKMVGFIIIASLCVGGYFLINYFIGGTGA